MSTHLQHRVESQMPSKLQKPNPANGAAPSTTRQSRQQDLSIDHPSPLQPSPAAPEVSRGPPISYKQPYGGSSTGHQQPASFSQRARGQMLAQEALEDDEYWDDQDDLTSPSRFSGDRLQDTGHSHPRRPLQNGVGIPSPGRQDRRGDSRIQSEVPLVDNSQPSAEAHRDRPRSSRQPAGLAPLNVDLSSPTSHSRTAKASAGSNETPRRDWPMDRSPLQTLEVKLKTSARRRSARG